jgi:hypothetical protein
MVREDESAWRPQTIVVLDNRAGSYRGPSYEAAIEAMASIGSRLLQSTRACEIITTGGVRLGVSHLGGLSSESRLLDELAMLTPDADSSPAASVAALRSDVRRGRMLIITGEPPDLAWFATLAGPGAPVTIVSCGAVLPATSNGVTVIDGRPGALVGAWNVAAITAPSNRRRAGRR